MTKPQYKCELDRYYALKDKYFDLWRKAENLLLSDKYFKRYQTIQLWIDKLMRGTH